MGKASRIKKPKDDDDLDAFTKAIIVTDDTKLDEMIEKVVVPAGTSILVSNYHTTSSENLALRQQLHDIAMASIAEDRDIILLCAPADGETVQDAVADGFLVYASHIVRREGAFYKMRGRVRRLMQDKEGTFTFFACDVEHADVLRADLADFGPRPPLSTLT